jgi:DNA-binding CsgD family transcriptional regulator
MPEIELQAEPGGLGERVALDLLHGVLRALASAEDTDDVLRVIAGHGVQWLQPVGAVLGRQVEDVVAVGSWGSSLDLSTDSFEHSRLARNPWSDAIRLCEPIWMSTIEDRKARYPELRVDDDCESLVVLPLVAHGAAFGVLGLAFATPRRFDDTERMFLVALADVCALWLLHPAQVRAESMNGHGAGPAGTAVVGAAFANGVAASNGNGNGDGRLPGDVKLTAREHEIAAALTRGQRSSAIARDLGISIYTVRKHISAILRKYDVTSQGELIARIFGQSSRGDSGSDEGERTAV